jgi:alpha,alpha-trehalose phosphorylase
VNDNAFTNLMARMNLRTPQRRGAALEEERPDDFRALVHDAVGLTDDEIEAWERAAAPCTSVRRGAGMNPQDEHVPRAGALGPQVDASGPKFPLLLHYHPLVIYRHQVIKQADVVLAMFLLGNEFTEEQKRRNFDYYDPITTGDSSLSACMQCIVAAEIGDEASALQYFDYALMMDLADVAGNVSDGVHVASAGGTWQALVFGFGGMRDNGGLLSFQPHLPRGWRTLEFSIRYRDRQLRLALGHHEERYLLDEGDPIEITVRGEPHRLEPGAPLVVTVPGGDRAAD